ncbi:hypothetical protein BGW80DRAFT_1396233 [Lactifluus volemus]|nr:hypothetical protein BGW80DRAFT_1396233 [Lactifluus volemus]
MFMKTILALSFAILALAAPSPQDPDIDILTFAIDVPFVYLLLLSLFMSADQPHKDHTVQSRLSHRVDFILMC